MSREIFPLDLTKSTEELKRLIAEHPDYPIVVLADSELTSDYYWNYASSIVFRVDEILDAPCPYDEETVCTDREIFDERLEDWLWDELSDFDSDGTRHEPPDEIFQKRLAEEKTKYEPFWKKVIAIYAST